MCHRVYSLVNCNSRAGGQYMHEVVALIVLQFVAVTCYLNNTLKSTRLTFFAHSETNAAGQALWEGNANS